MKNVGKFYIVEENHVWTPCKAKSLKSAKCAAKKLQVYLNTKLFVSIKEEDGQYRLLSTWEQGRWYDV